MSTEQNQPSQPGEGFQGSPAQELDASLRAEGGPTRVPGHTHDALPDGDEGPHQDASKIRRSVPSQDMRDVIAVRRRMAMAKEVGEEQAEGYDLSTPHIPGVTDADDDTDKPAPGGEREPQSEADPTVRIERHAREKVDSTKDPLVRVIVLGEERLVPKSEVDAKGGVAPYQMHMASLKHLEDVKELRASLKRQQAEFSERLKHLDEMMEGRGPAVRPAAGANDEVGEDGLTDAQRAELKEMEEDDFEDAVIDTRRRVFITENRIQGTTQPAQPVSLDADAVAKRAMELTRQEAREVERKKANTYFAEHYHHIESDPDMQLVAKRKIQELMREDPSRSLLEIVQEAGAHAEKRFNVRRASNGAAPAPQGDEQRVQRKRQTQSVRSDASARIAPSVNREPPAPTGSEIVEEMRKARGQS